MNTFIAILSFLIIWLHIAVPLALYLGRHFRKMAEEERDEE